MTYKERILETVQKADKYSYLLKSEETQMVDEIFKMCLDIAKHAYEQGVHDEYQGLCILGQDNFEEFKKRLL
jgi:hypothetical protein